MTCAFKCINLISQLLIWAMLDCRYKLDQIGIRQHKLERAKEKNRDVGVQSSRLDSKAETPKIQIKKDLVDWMVIQATGLIVNQAETPEFKNLRIQSTGW